MNDFSTYYPMIIECIVNVVRVVMTVAFGVLVLPWIKNTAIPWLQEKHLYGLICKFVRAAEKLSDAGTIDKTAKLSYVIGLIKNRLHIEMTPEIRAMIECAVGELDDEFAYNMLSIADALTTAEAAADLIVTEDEEDAPAEVAEPEVTPDEAPVE